MEEKDKNFIQNNKSSPYQDEVEYDGQNFIRKSQKTKQNSSEQGKTTKDKSTQDKPKKDKATQGSATQDKSSKSEDVMAKYRNNKKMGVGKKIAIATLIALATALSVKGGVDLVKEGKLDFLIPKGDPMNKLSSEDQKKIARYLTTTGVHKDGSLVDLTSLTNYLDISGDAVITEDGNLLVTKAQILKGEEEYITHIEKTLSSTKGKMLQDKHLYLDSDGNVISYYEYALNENGKWELRTGVDYDPNMLSFASKAAKSAGESKTVDALNLTVISSEESLDETSKERLGDKNTVLQVRTNDKVKVEGEFGVSGSQNGLQTTVGASIITSDKNKNDNSLANVTFVHYENGENEIVLNSKQILGEHFSIREGASYNFSKDELEAKLGRTISF